MTTLVKDTVRKLALRIHRDPTADSEKRQLARALLMLLDGRLP